MHGSAHSWRAESRRVFLLSGKGDTIKTHAVTAYSHSWKFRQSFSTHAFHAALKYFFSEAYAADASDLASDTAVHDTTLITDVPLCQKDPKRSIGH